MKNFTAYYRYNTLTGPNPCEHFKTIQAKSLAEAKRIAKCLIGREEYTTWLVSVEPTEG